MLNSQDSATFQMPQRVHEQEALRSVSGQLLEDTTGNLVSSALFQACPLPDSCQLCDAPPETPAA